MKDCLGRTMVVGDVAVYPVGPGVTSMDIITKETPSGIRLGGGTYKCPGECPGECVLITKGYIDARGLDGYDNLLKRNEKNMDHKPAKEVKAKKSWSVRVTRRYKQSMKHGIPLYLITVRPLVNNNYVIDIDKALPSMSGTAFYVCKSRNKGQRCDRVLNGNIELQEGYYVKDQYLTSKLMLKYFGDTYEKPTVLGEFQDYQAVEEVLNNCQVQGIEVLKCK